FASGTGFLPPETEAPKATSETLSACRDRKVAVRNREKWPRNPVVQLSVGQNRVSARCALSDRNGIFGCGDRATKIAARNNELRPCDKSRSRPLSLVRQERDF